MTGTEPGGAVSRCRYQRLDELHEPTTVGRPGRGPGEGGHLGVAHGLTAEHHRAPAPPPGTEAGGQHALVRWAEHVEQYGIGGPARGQGGLDDGPGPGLVTDPEALTQPPGPIGSGAGPGRVPGYVVVVVVVVVVAGHR